MIRRVRLARHYQRKNAPVRRLADSYKPSVARLVSESMRSLGDMVDVADVADALRHGQDSTRKINFGHYREVLKKPFGQLAKLHDAAAQLGVRKINGAFNQARRSVHFHKRFRKDAGDQYNFDSLDPETQRKVRELQDQLIAQLEQDARDSIATIISDGIRDGTDMDEIASNIRDLIGLTDTQAQAVLNYQRMLQNLDPDALARKLRNSEYDAAVQDAIDSGVDLSDAAIENMVSDYVDNYLDYRASAIAITETTRASNLGLHDAYSQAVDRGVFPDEAVTRFWQLADRPCPICESIVDNNPDGVGLSDSFDSDNGPQDDPPVHTNCECSVEYVTDLTMVPDSEQAEAA